MVETRTRSNRQYLYYIFIDKLLNDALIKLIAKHLIKLVQSYIYINIIMRLGKTGRRKKWDVELLDVVLVVLGMRKNGGRSGFR